MKWDTNYKNTSYVNHSMWENNNIKTSEGFINSSITPFDYFIWFLGYLYSPCVKSTVSIQFPC